MPAKEGLLVIKAAVLAGMATLVLAGNQAPPPLFTKDERDAVVKFWSEQGRYTTRLPDTADKNGPFQVRLSVGGSVWLREYNRARGMNKVPPTTTAQPQNDEQKVWQAWIDTKIEHDRWNARRLAEDSNRRLTGHDSKFDDKDLPTSEPPDPGAAPEALVTFAGNPPPFAEAVVPLMHEVTFEDGTKVAFADNRRMRKNYAYYRFEKGVASEGVPTKNMPGSKLRQLCDMAGIDESELKVMKAVSMLEGGFDAVNTYDTGYVSVGFIQFATLREGGNSLGELMKLYKSEKPAEFGRDFRRYGIDVTTDGKLACVDPLTGAELTGELAVRKVIEDKRLIAVFQYDGLKSDAYDAMQIKAAKLQFYPADDPIIVTVNGQPVTGKVSDVFHSESGIATLMDRKVNTGKLDPLLPTLEECAAVNQARSLEELSQFEYDLTSAMQYRRDYLQDPTLSQPEPKLRSKPLPSRSGDRKGRGGRKG